MLELIEKRDGRIEPRDDRKINGWGEWGTRHLQGRVDYSKASGNAVKNLPKQATSQQFMEQLISEILTERSWAAYLFAGRLYAVLKRKEIFGSEIPPTLFSMHGKLQEQGFMAVMNYSHAEYTKLEGVIDHSRDYEYPEFSLKFMHEKYSIRNYVTGQVFESPQFIYMRMAMAVCEFDPIEERMYNVRRLYNLYSQKMLSNPTPNYLYLGTNHRGFASCCIYVAGDSEESMLAALNITWKMTVNSAGLGSMFSTRTVGDPIDGGRIQHSGRYPYLNALAKMTGANKQAGRAGAGTTSTSMFDPEAIDIVQYRNPLMPENKQLRDLHYNMMANAWFVQKVIDNEDIFTFTEWSQPELYNAFFSPNIDRFVELYEALDRNVLLKKNYVSARKLVLLSFNEAYTTGTAYVSFVDEMNRHTPLIIDEDNRIHCSNLCVAPETMLLTDKGNVPIDTLENKTVNIWNGHEWSEVLVRKTGEQQPLMVVRVNTGQFLECTPYHKFHITTLKGTEEVNAGDLKGGETLVRGSLPIIEGGTEVIDGAYDVGYAAKLDDNEIIPDTLHYTAKTRHEWLGGHLDRHGVVTVIEDESDNEDGSEFLLHVETTEYTHLHRLQFFIQELGIASKIDPETPDRLYIDGADVQKLTAQGMPSIHSAPHRDVNRSMSTFVKIEQVFTMDRTDDTYCFTEPKRNMAVFNGILTGQCTEIMEITKPYQNVMDLHTAEDHGRGEIAMCNLGGVNYAEVDYRNDELMAEVMYYSLKTVDYTIDHAYYPFEHLKMTAQNRRYAGISVMGLATVLARENLRWDTFEGKQKIHEVFEAHMYHLIYASIRISKERGLAPWIHKTKWPQGWTPMQTYNRNVDSIGDFKNRKDWTVVSNDLIANGGIAHSMLATGVPGESSSKALGATNSYYPIPERNMVKSDGNNITTYWAAQDEDLLKGKYQLAYDIPTKDMIDCYAVMQKWLDQGISADLYRTWARGENIIKEEEVVFIYCYMAHMGMKTRYYTRNRRPKQRNQADATKLVFVNDKGDISLDTGAMAQDAVTVNQAAMESVMAQELSKDATSSAQSSHQLDPLVAAALAARQQIQDALADVNEANAVAQLAGRASVLHELAASDASRDPSENEYDDHDGGNGCDGGVCTL